MSLQLVEPSGPRSIQFIGIHHPGRSYRVHGPVQSHFGPAVADYHASPTLRITHATAQIEISGARCHTVEVYRIGQQAADLNLTQRDIVGEGPVRDLFASLVSEQQPTGREVAGARDGPPQERRDQQTRSYGRDNGTKLASGERLFLQFTHVLSSRGVAPRCPRRVTLRRPNQPHADCATHALQPLLQGKPPARGSQLD